MKNCTICNKILVNKQKLFCSVKCKQLSINHKHQTYLTQVARGISNKRKLINIHGGKCKICGYNKSLSSLSFHHKIPEDKKFSLDIRKCSNSKWSSLLEESNKCDLLCLNCHSELHFNRPGGI